MRPSPVTRLWPTNNVESTVKDVLKVETRLQVPVQDPQGGTPKQPRRDRVVRQALPEPLRMGERTGTGKIAAAAAGNGKYLVAAAGNTLSQCACGRSLQLLHGGT